MTRRQSDPELVFAANAATSDVLPTLQHELRFHPYRRWRFDFALSNVMLAFEIEGATWARGRHTRGGGFAADCEKYNEAAILGWQVFRFPAEWVYDGRAIQVAERAYLARIAEDRWRQTRR